MEMGVAGIPGPGGGDDPNEGNNFFRDSAIPSHYTPKMPLTRKGEEVDLQQLLDNLSRNNLTIYQQQRIHYITQYVLNNNGNLPPQVGVVPLNIDQEHNREQLPNATRGFIVILGVVIMGIILYYNGDHVRQFLWEALPSVMPPPLNQGVTEVAQQFPNRLPEFAAAIWEAIRAQDPTL